MAINPQKKLIKTNKRFGNPAIKFQQGSTRIVYDMIDISLYLATGSPTTLQFFRNVATRQFPLTNLTKNQFEVGESIIVKRMYVGLVLAPENGGGTAPTISSISNLEDAGLDFMYASLMQFYITNNRVIKDFPLLSNFPDFNKNAYQEGGSVFVMDTDIVIPPLLEFRADLELPETTTQVQLDSPHLLLAIEGPAAIIAPKSPY